MSDQDQARQAQVLQEFVQLTGISEARCQEYLEAADWDIGRAAQAFYLDTEDATAEEASSSAPAPADNYTGPRTLDGRPAPQSQRAPAASSSRQAQPKRKGVATLGSLGSSSHQHDDDDDEDDDDESEDGRNPRDLFAGGEKSGLAVQDPTQGGSGSGARRLVRDIMSKAKENASKAGRDENEQPSRTTGFRGSGQTLGGDGKESRVIPDPNAPAGGSSASANEPIQERVLHLWSDGFSIDGGELHRFDDPANAADLEMIRNGRAPLHLMNVRYDQPVDVKLNQHSEAWHPLPQAYKPFGGSGRRLGSEVPGDGSSSTATAVAPAAPAAATPSAPTNTVDDSQPTITIRIQLPDGTRLPARFNTTQTLETVYGFVQRASPATQSRAWVLATTFPNKDHTDRSLVLGEIPEFKKGGTAVVKWA